MKEDEMIVSELEMDLAERALICSLLLDGTAIPEVERIVRPEMFSNFGFGFAFEALIAIYNSGRYPDLVLVEIEMKLRNPEWFRTSGGLSALLERIEDFRLQRNAVEYAKVIKRSYLLDCLHKLLKCKAMACLSCTTDFETLAGDCISTIQQLCEDNREAAKMSSYYQLTLDTIRLHKQRMEQNIDLRMMRTGLRGLDGIIGGFFRKELTVLGGVTSDGKTALSMFMAMNVAKKNYHVLHFSFEMTGEQTVDRNIAAYTPVEADRLRIGGIHETDIRLMEEYAAEVEHLPYFFVDDPVMSLEALRSEVLQRSRRGECDLVFVDYLHAMDVGSDQKERQELIIRRIMVSLKKLAEEANCALLLVAQLNRDLLKRDSKVPQMSDYRDSGAIEYVADTAIVLSRHTAVMEKKDNPLKIYVLKNRNGPRGVTEVYHNSSFSHFHEANKSLHFEDNEQPY